MPGLPNILPRRVKRLFRRRRKDAVELGQQADRNIERFLIRRFHRLSSVRRFVLLWVALFTVLSLAMVFQIRSLSPHYQTLRPASGGLFSEGLLGSFSNANPIYAISGPDIAISRLVFSGLLKYDTNNQLIGDLAESWELNEAETQYKFKLKPGITWHDGQKFTADDVVFTYQMAQRQETQSPLYTSWSDITVKKVDDYTVTFDLPNPLSAFPHSLINGIVPEHLLKNVPAEQLRSAPFNANPIGTGPFKWKYVEILRSEASNRQQRITLAAFDDYWAGRPKLNGISITTYDETEHLLKAFKDKKINGVGGLDSVPPELAADDSITEYHIPLTSAVMTFFNNSKDLLKDAAVRQALVRGVDTKQLRAKLPENVNPVDAPLLKGQLGYDPSLTQLTYNRQEAENLLDKAGWQRGNDGIRQKNDQPLQLSLSSQNSDTYIKTAKLLQDRWKELGVKVDVNYYSGEDLNSIVIANHDYDVLLYGINIGVDPDVFVYWHSTQANRLNLSEYQSKVADQALEAGRTRSDADLRKVKYQPFLQAWRSDAPALALYQPNFIYLNRGPIFNFERISANSSVDRFYNAYQWAIRQTRQTQ